MPRKIAVVTATRADYGLLYYLMKEIAEDDALELQVIATGTHLSPEFGLTYQQVEADGFQITEKVDMLLSSDSAVAIAKSMGLATISFADTLDRLQPDIIVLLGDRYEILAVAEAALLLGIPIAHIHGGELTQGAMDDSIRHAITKLAHVHFPAADVYQQRLIQLGEAPDRIYQFGAPGLDHIARTPLLSKQELKQELDIHFADPTFLITYHPVTLQRNPLEGLQVIFSMLNDFPEAQVIFTKSNADEGGRTIGRLIDEYVALHPAQCKAFVSLGTKNYLSVASQVDVVIGNSSSALIEVPLLATPSINMGIRQQGRLRASSVIDCEETPEALCAAIQQALSPEFQHMLSNITTPYGTGDASVKIKDVLKKIKLDNLLLKQFHDRLEGKT